MVFESCTARKEGRVSFLAGPTKLRRIKMEMFEDLKYGIKNIIRWFLIIWQDRNWDHYFIYRIFWYKLVRMEQNIRKHGSSMNAEKDADTIKTCIDALDRLMEDDYNKTGFEEHDKKWGEPEFNFIVSEDNPSYSTLEIKRERVITGEDEEQAAKELSEAVNEENALKEKDLDILFTTMRENIESWWD